jgi:hypothetical protein
VVVESSPENIPLLRQLAVLKFRRLTDSGSFNLYAVNGSLWKGGLDIHLVLSFKRADLKNPIFDGELNQLGGRESIQEGAIWDAIESYRHNQRKRFEQFHSELSRLKDERRRPISWFSGIYQ